MVWFSGLFSGQETQDSRLTAGQQQLIAAWRDLPAPDLGRSHYRCRYVLVDVAVAGPDWQHGPLSSIGALPLVDGLIDLHDALHVVVAQDLAPGAAADALAGQSPPAEISDGQRADALLSFLGFIGKAPLVAYHASFAARRIERSLTRSLGVELNLPWIDLAWVMAGLFGEIGQTDGRLDAWLGHFGIDSIQRHHPVSDAYATAQLLQIAIAHASRKGFETAASLIDLEKARRHLYQSG